MRRTAKPFTVELKRGARVPKNGHAASGIDGSGGVTGGHLRFRDAERMFRNGAAEIEATQAPFPPKPRLAADASLDVANAPPTERRILPDLIAEAALSVQNGHDALEQAPRRRGRPPKNRTGELPSLPLRLTRDVAGDALADSFADADETDDAPVLSPMVLDLAASARRRAARDTSHLPRAERWKRRVPRVCW